MLTALNIYKFITFKSEGFFSLLLNHRAQKGKEDKNRLDERKGLIALEFKNNAPLIWFHAASVGEAQSALILINLLYQKYANKLNILLTSGTVTSASFVKDRLPENTTHRYFPLDHPLWAQRFLDNVNPHIAFWVESELWPNMLTELKRRNIPVILINGRMSAQSFKNWQKLPKTANIITSCFDLLCVQTETDAKYYKSLGAENVKITDNLKYSAKPLAYDPKEYDKLKSLTEHRKIWFYSSTHDSEEMIACKVHQKLKNDFPDLLTVIAPRHPARTAEIISTIKANYPELKITLRKNIPSISGFNTGAIDADTDIYIANTMGELGLFYKLSPFACIGRSLSKDGGGGHNPIEAAMLDCAILSGKNVSNFFQVYDEMEQCGAFIKVENEEDLIKQLSFLIQDKIKTKNLRNKSRLFAEKKSEVADNIMDIISPYIERI